MEKNSLKSNCLLVSRSRTDLPPYGDLLYEGLTPNNSDSLTIFGVLFGAKFKLERHVMSVFSSASPGLGILRKVHIIFGDKLIFGCCFCCFLLSLLEYCSPVWYSGATCHLSLDSVVCIFFFFFFFFIWPIAPLGYCGASWATPPARGARQPPLWRRSVLSGAILCWPMHVHPELILDSLGRFPLESG